MLSSSCALEAPASSSRSRCVPTALVALASRVALLAFLLPLAGPPYDSSFHLLPPGALQERRALDSAVVRALAPLASWDGAYFLHLAAPWGGYAYEQFHAFFPALPAALSAAARALPLSPRPALLLTGALLSVACFVAAAVALEDLTRRVTRCRAASRAAALAFCVSPGGVFFSALYTEAPFAALAFAGLALCEAAADAAEGGGGSGGERVRPPPQIHWVRRAYLRLAGGAALLCAASAVRSNGLTTALFVAWSGARIWRAGAARERRAAASAVAVGSVGGGRGRRALSRCYAWLAHWAGVALLCALVCVPFITFQWYAHALYCAPAPAALRNALHAVLGGAPLPGLDAWGGGARGTSYGAPSWGEDAPHRDLHDRPWCGGDGSEPPSLFHVLLHPPTPYAFVQATHWGVGLGRRWVAPNQLPQFALATPMACAALSAFLFAIAGGGCWAQQRVCSEGLCEGCGGVGMSGVESPVPQEGGDKPNTREEVTAGGGVVRRREGGRGVRGGSRPPPVSLLVSHTPCDGGVATSTEWAELSEIITDALTPLLWQQQQQEPAPAPLPPLALSSRTRTLPYVAHWVLLAGATIVAAHPQVATRLCAAACPALYWWLARTWRRGGRVMRAALAVWCVGYSLVGGALFMHSMNWT